MTARFLGIDESCDPRTRNSASGSENEAMGVRKPNFDEILRVARLTHRCAECGGERNYLVRPKSLFCSTKCGQRFRHRRRYAEDGDAQRVRSRAYYWANREKVLEKAAARRGTTRAPEPTHCSECCAELTGRQRVTCGKASCRDRRFRRLHPEAYAERERLKVERRREKRRAAKASGSA
jgi:hypothetical protein